MSDLIEIYETLRDLDLCRSQKDFSRDWLGRSENYLAQITSSGASPSVSSLGMLTGLLHALLLPLASEPELRVAFRRVRSAWVAAAVMWEGEAVRLRMPSRYRRHPCFTAPRQKMTISEIMGPKRPRMGSGVNDNERPVDRACDICGRHFETGTFLIIDGRVVSIECASCHAITAQDDGQGCDLCES